MYNEEGLELLLNWMLACIVTNVSNCLITFQVSPPFWRQNLHTQMNKSFWKHLAWTG